MSMLKVCVWGVACVHTCMFLGMGAKSGGSVRAGWQGGVRASMCLCVRALACTCERKCACAYVSHAA